MAKMKKRRAKEPEEDKVKYCKCPNCQQQAIRIGRKIICEYCDTFFVERKKDELHVLKTEVTQEIIKPKKQKRRDFLSWFDK